MLGLYFIDFIINILLLIFAVRCLIPETELLINPLFTPLYRATEKLFHPVQRTFPWFYRHPVTLPLLFIVILIAFRGILFELVAIRLLGHSILSFLMIQYLPTTIELGVILSVMNAIDFCFQALSVLLIIAYLVPSYSSNPIVSLGNRIVSPIIKLNARITNSRSNSLPLLSLVSLFLLHLTLMALLTAFIVSYHNISPFGVPPADAISAIQYQFEYSGRGFSTDLSSFAAPLIYNSFNLMLRALGFFSFLIIANAILSWFSPDPFNPLVQLLALVSEPLLRPVRRFLPPLAGIDFSPVVVLLIIEFSRTGLDAVVQSLLKLN